MSESRVKTPADLSAEEILRYGRHLVLPEVGLEGQRRLAGSSVLVVGLGGLGSPAALYLAAAGVGRIGLLDDDVVDVSNLQRQVLHGTRSVGRPKVESAAARLRELNPHLRLDVHGVRLTSANALELLAPYQVVVDGSDNFPARYLVNDACALLGRPDVFGSVSRFEGQLSVFDARRGPCYRCLHPTPPPPDLVPSCAEGGVLGVLPGVIGALQAAEALKLLLGLGEGLVGRLLLFDALGMSFRELALRKNESCALCGSRPTIRTLTDEATSCGVRDGAPDAGAGRPAGHDEDAMLGLFGRRKDDITAPELAARLAREDPPVLLDVREPHEWHIAHLAGAVLMPLQGVPQRCGELDPAREIVVYCHHGRRSRVALEFLRRSGFTRVWNLAGGIEAWSRQVDPGVPRY